MIILSPLLGLLINWLFFKKDPELGSKIASFAMWIGLINALLARWMGRPFFEKNLVWGFIPNEIAWLMAALILGISAIVHQFSLSYMAGDRNYRRYFLFLSLITVSSLFMVASDHILLLITFWTLSNLILTLLITHKVQWEAAKNSGYLAMKTFLWGLVFLSAGAGLLAYQVKSFSLKLITENSASLPNSIRTIALLLIILAALTQSGGWPFHRWLISSLNSPTPVSAFMHAGLVNGGGFLIVRFAPVFFHDKLALDVLFVLAVLTLILGGIWKLLQSDIKRMLACSTMTQMGFMMMQCSLGLFSAALAHLCLHGLFKAFLFLKSGSTISEPRRSSEERVSTFSIFVLSLVCGVFGVIGFMWASMLPLALVDTNTVLIFFCWVASSQIAHTVLQKQTSLFFVLAVSVTCLVLGSLYGWTVALIEESVSALQISQPFSLSPLHLIAMSLILCIWLGLNLKPVANLSTSFWRRFYVAMLNASQPDPKTITSSKNGYQF